MSSVFYSTPFIITFKRIFVVEIKKNNQRKNYIFVSVRFYVHKINDHDCNKSNRIKKRAKKIS